MATLSIALAAAIGDALHAAGEGRFVARHVRPVGGGCISHNLCVDDGKRRCFVKLARDGAAMFAAEADGLAALARCPAFVVPRVLACGNSDDTDFLVLEWLEIDGNGDPAQLGAALAELHAIEADAYGWPRNNFIGRTPQRNHGPTDDGNDWPAFFRDCRLRPQLQLAAERGAPELLAQAEPLLADTAGQFARHFAGHRPTASLLHGDLWSGNTGFVGGRPALFDPAVYAGDGETDLAMAALFGGFAPAFFAAYAARRPLADGWPARRRLYQLYHVLNHYNLFGGGYREQAAALIAQLT